MSFQDLGGDILPPFTCLGRIACVLCTLAAAALAEGPIPPADSGKAPPLDRIAETHPWQEVQDCLLGGKVSFDLRLRAEYADQQGMDASQAYTERLRLGYGTKPFRGLSFFVDIEDVRSADYDLYNAAGLNNQPNKTVIADVQDTELNRLFALYERDRVTAIVGRQRIILDDARFVGNVAWRQQEQTFDAATITTTIIPQVKVFYGYVDEVNRIFGPDARRDFASDSHLLNAKYDGLSWGTLTAFAYLLDFRNSQANSSSSVGARFSGDQDVSDDLTWNYTASYAYQEDAAENPLNYATHYYAVQTGVAWRQTLRFGAGYEVLGSQGGRASFQTPIATLHGFNGWADLFLTTPADGIEDLYFTIGGSFPRCGLDASIIGHLFFSEDRATDFGRELDAQVKWRANKVLAVTGAVALFDGANNRLPDYLQRVWLQTEITF